jgi:hypothetical protein
LAASEDLQQDRNEFELYFRRQNDNYRVSGQYLEIVRGDNLFDAMSRTRKQDDYLRELEECDVFVCLVGGKAGAGIVEEFDCAWAQFKTLARPFIFTFFKDVATSTSHNKDAMVSIWDFQKKLADLGHTPTLYKTDAELKLRFAEQLGHLLPKLIESSAK